MVALLMVLLKER